MMITQYPNKPKLRGLKSCKVLAEVKFLAVSGSAGRIVTVTELNCRTNILER